MDINVGGSIFSIPSPIQTAMYIKEAGAEFGAARRAHHPFGSVEAAQRPRDCQHCVRRGAQRRASRLRPAHRAGSAAARRAGAGSRPCAPSRAAPTRRSRRPRGRRRATRRRHCREAQRRRLARPRWRDAASSAGGCSRPGRRVSVVAMPHPNGRHTFPRHVRLV